MRQERLSTVAQLHQRAKHLAALPVSVHGNPDVIRSPSDTLPKARHRIAQEPLWVAVSFPFLPMEALGKTTQQQPMAVYTQRGQTHTVITPNQLAQKSGIRSGMTLTAAQVLSPALQAVPQDVSAESDWLTRLALLASRWTPTVSIAEDNLLLEISGSTRLFGGTNQLLGKIRSGLAFETQSPCISAMPTAASALLCVRNGKSLCITAKEGIHAAIRELPKQCGLGTFPQGGGALVSCDVMCRLKHIHRLAGQLPGDGRALELQSHLDHIKRKGADPVMESQSNTRE